MTTPPFLGYEPLLARAHAHALDYLERLSGRYVGAQASRNELLVGLDTELTQSGERPEAVLDLVAAQIARGAPAGNSPRYFGFVTGGATPIALAADWLVSTWDQNAAIYAMSPFASVIEEIAADWLLELFDLPRDCGVGFVTGGQMASMTCLAAARHSVLRRVGYNVETDGLIGAPRVNVVCSAESHITIEVALRYLGLGSSCIRRVDTDEQGRMKPTALRALLAMLDGPTIVCAQAGNVNTGAFDPLREIGEACSAHGAWLHVDGAFGLWARASADARIRELADGVELADSWGTDAHKWLNVPYDCGVAIVKSREDHRAAMTTAAAYLVQGTGPERDAVDWGPDFSRRARGVPVYAQLRTLGRQGVADLVDRLCLRAQQMAGRLCEEQGITILNDVVLNQVLVRFRDDDQLTRRVVAAVQRDGTSWLAATTWQGKVAVRISVSNHATTEHDIAQSANAILRVYRTNCL